MSAIVNMLPRSVAIIQENKQADGFDRTWSAPLIHWTKLANKEEGKILKERSQIEGGPEGEQ